MVMWLKNKTTRYPTENSCLKTVVYPPPPSSSSNLPYFVWFLSLTHPLRENAPTAGLRVFDGRWFFSSRRITLPNATPASLVSCAQPFRPRIGLRGNRPICFAPVGIRAGLSSEWAPLTLPTFRKSNFSPPRFNFGDIHPFPSSFSAPLKRRRPPCPRPAPLCFYPPRHPIRAITTSLDVLGPGLLGSKLSSVPPVLELWAQSGAAFCALSPCEHRSAPQGLIPEGMGMSSS